MKTYSQEILNSNLCCKIMPDRPLQLWWITSISTKKGGSILKPGIFGNCVFATFSKNIKQLTYAGCQPEIPLNSSRFRMNRKFCYQNATKFSTMFRVGVEVYFTRMGLWRVVWLWRISGGYSQVIMWLTLCGVLRFEVVIVKFFFVNFAIFLICEGLISQQPPKIVAPFFINFFTYS